MVQLSTPWGDREALFVKLLWPLVIIITVVQSLVFVICVLCSRLYFRVFGFGFRSVCWCIFLERDIWRFKISYTFDNGCMTLTLNVRVLSSLQYLMWLQCEPGPKKPCFVSKRTSCSDLRTSCSRRKDKRILWSFRTIILNLTSNNHRRNNLRQVVHTLLPLSPSSIIWYQRKQEGKRAHHVMH